MPKWISPPPTKCDICRDMLTEEFIDGATQIGPWAIMCRDCHREFGYGLGIGRGQLYDLKTLEKKQ